MQYRGGVYSRRARASLRNIKGRRNSRLQSASHFQAGVPRCRHVRQGPGIRRLRRAGCGKEQGLDRARLAPEI